MSSTSNYNRPPYTGGSSQPSASQQQQQQTYQGSYAQTSPPPGAPQYYTPSPNPYAQAPKAGSVGHDETDFLRSNVSTQLGLQIGSQMINAGQDYVNKNRSALRDAAGQPAGYRPPREDINSPDLYIPAMAAVTYVLLVGVALGLRKAFHPEKLGVTATGAIVFILCELLLVKLGAYILSLGNDVSILDMLAIIGYNFFPLIVTLLFDLFLGRTARLIVFIYCSLAMAFFMLRSLRYSFLPDTATPLVVNQRRTRVHFLFGVVFVQIVCSYFLLV